MTSSGPAAGAVPPSPPAGRYGERPTRRRPGAVAAAVVLAAAFLGWVVWAALGASRPAVSGQVTGFDIRGAHEIRATVAVTAPHPGRVSCRVQALDSTHGVVGVTTARVRVGSSGTARTEVAVRTRDIAVTAVVDTCSAEGRTAD